MPLGRRTPGALRHDTNLECALRNLLVTPTTQASYIEIDRALGFPGIWAGGVTYTPA